MAPKCVPELPFLLQVSVLVEEIMKEVWKPKSTKLPSWILQQLVPIQSPAVYGFGILILQANPSGHLLIWNSNKAVYGKLVSYNNQ